MASSSGHLLSGTSTQPRSVRKKKQPGLSPLCPHGAATAAAFRPHSGIDKSEVIQPGQSLFSAYKLHLLQSSIAVSDEGKHTLLGARICGLALQHLPLPTAIGVQHSENTTHRHQQQKPKNRHRFTFILLTLLCSRAHLPPGSPSTDSICAAKVAHSRCARANSSHPFSVR